MDNYQLAKIVQWAGTLQTRKRLQKVVYLLQAQKCPLAADFFLHHYGPYSNDVAQLTDILVNKNLLIEHESDASTGKKFDYQLSEKAISSMEQFEQTDRGRVALQSLQPFESSAKKLLQAELSELEYASTIAHFYGRTQSWPEALESACKFKRLQPNSSVAQTALQLAKDVVGGAN